MNVILFYFIIALIALICQYIDSSMGGGYGTILVPILLFIDVDPVVLIPIVLITEIFSGFTAAMLHHYVGNAEFAIKFDKESDKRFKLTEDAKIVVVLSLFGIAGGIAAASLAINVTSTVVSTYIGILVILVGFFVLLKIKWNFSWKKISLIGIVASFNKGLSGGGYGPLISSGQIMTDRNPRQAVASTSFSEAVVCVASLIIYFSFNGSHIDIPLLIALFVGTAISVPFAVFTVKYLPLGKLQPYIGGGTIILGIMTLIHTFLM